MQSGSEPRMPDKQVQREAIVKLVFRLIVGEIVERLPASRKKWRPLINKDYARPRPSLERTPHSNSFRRFAGIRSPYSSFISGMMICGTIPGSGGMNTGLSSGSGIFTISRQAIATYLKESAASEVQSSFAVFLNTAFFSSYPDDIAEELRAQVHTFRPPISAASSSEHNANDGLELRSWLPLPEPRLTVICQLTPLSLDFTF
jgi:hypothetical protein